MDFAFLILLSVAAIKLATPLLLAATGELVVEKSGVLNLGIEGMMLIGALTAFMMGSYIDVERCEQYSDLLKMCLLGSNELPIARYLITIIAGGLAGAVLSALFAALVLIFRSNQVATGLGLTILGLTMTNSLSSGSSNLTVGQVQHWLPKDWSAMPIIGPFLTLDLLVPFAFIAMLGALLVLKRTRLGLIIRAVGENHDSAYTLGYPVNLIRFGCILFGGFMSGVAGAYISMIQIGAPTWREGITAGAGWLALALILFGTWRPMRVMGGALLFGLALSLELRLQVFNWLPGWIISFGLPILPYLIPIIVLALISADAAMIRRNAPASLGRSFNPSS